MLYKAKKTKKNDIRRRRGPARGAAPSPLVTAEADGAGPPAADDAKAMQSDGNGAAAANAATQLITVAATGPPTFQCNRCSTIHDSLTAIVLHWRKTHNKDCLLDGRLRLRRLATGGCMHAVRRGTLHRNRQAHRHVRGGRSGPRHRTCSRRTCESMNAAGWVC